MCPRTRDPADRLRRLLPPAAPAPQAPLAQGATAKAPAPPPVTPVAAQPADDAWWSAPAVGPPLRDPTATEPRDREAGAPATEATNAARRGADGFVDAAWGEDTAWVVDDANPTLDPDDLSPPGRPAGSGRRARLVALPESLRGARVAPGWRAVVGAAIVLLVALGLVGWRVADATRAAEPVAAAVVLPSAPVGEPAPTPIPIGTAATPGAQGPGAAPTAPDPGPVAPTTTPGAGPAPAGVVVHVAGLVRRPGVVRLPGGSRVDDALRRCGGTLPGADLTAVNLARPVVDGEQIVVPTVGRPIPPAGGAPPPVAPGAATPRTPIAPVDLNAADAAALDALPGVGPVLAQRILQWRAEHGRFSSVDELGEVTGVGDKTLERLRPLVRV